MQTAVYAACKLRSLFQTKQSTDWQMPGIQIHSCSICVSMEDALPGFRLNPHRGGKMLEAQLALLWLAVAPMRSDLTSRRIIGGLSRACLADYTCSAR